MVYPSAPFKRNNQDINGLTEGVEGNGAPSEIELALSSGNWILNPARLPVPPQGHCHCHSGSPLGQRLLREFRQPVYQRSENSLFPEDDMSETRAAAQLSVDIGGTFTDIVLEAEGRRATARC